MVHILLRLGSGAIVEPPSQVEAWHRSAVVLRIVKEETLAQKRTG